MEIQPNKKLNRDASAGKDICIRIKGAIRSSGLLAFLSPEDLQTFISILTFVDGSGRCDLSARTLGQALDLSEKQALLIGAGEMIEMALESLRGDGLEAIRVVNRTPERAAELASRFGATAHGLDELPTLLPEVDVVLTSIGGSRPILSVGDISQALRARGRLAGRCRHAVVALEHPEHPPVQAHRLYLEGLHDLPPAVTALAHADHGGDLLARLPGQEEHAGHLLRRVQIPGSRPQVPLRGVEVLAEHHHLDVLGIPWVQPVQGIHRDGRRRGHGP